MKPGLWIPDIGCPVSTRVYKKPPHLAGTENWGWANDGRSLEKMVLAAFIVWVPFHVERLP